MNGGMKTGFLSGWLVVAALGGGGCAAQPQATEYPYRVVATVGMVADIVREVAGEQAMVSNLIGEGVDPHLYNPTRGDVIALSQADIIFYNGLMLEGKMPDVLQSMARRGKPVHAVAEAILHDIDFVLPGENYEHDPHLWMDVQGWIKATDAVAEALTAFDPEHGADYARRAAEYRERLQVLDAYAREVLASIPPEYRILVTAHDAFGYLGRAYGIEVRGIQGISTESEAGLRDIENLVAFLVEHRIPAVFIETSLSDRNVRALVEGARSRGHALEIGGELFSDAMGPAGSYEGTYIGMIDHNVTTIARALGGQAPVGGLHGRLAADSPADEP